MEHIKINDDSIRIAVKDWLEDPLKAEAIYGHISGWDTSEVTDMWHLFSFKEQFNEPIGNWDVSNVTNMSAMFQKNTNFNQDISSWDVSNVTNMAQMFAGCEAFNQDISSWDVSNVIDMHGMFSFASAFNQPIGNWHMDNVTNLDDMFRHAINFNQDISDWNLNASPKKIQAIFKTAKSLKKEFKPKYKSNSIQLSAENKKIFSKIRGLITSRDFEKIDLGVELLISLDEIQLFESLLKDCKLNFSSIEKNDFFTGSKPAQPFLDYSLNKIIFNVPYIAKIDDTLKLDKISSVDTKTFVVFPPIKKFSSLISLKISMDNLSKDLNFVELLVNKNVIDLEILNAQYNLEWLKNFKQIKSLYFKPNLLDNPISYDEYNSFKFLENLEHLEFFCSNVPNLNFLENCINIQKLHLTIFNKYDDEIRLESLDFLSKLENLEDLVISGLSNSDISIEALSKCNQIKNLTIDINDENAFQLKFLNKCESLETLNLKGHLNFKLFGKISEIQMLSGLKRLKSIVVSKLGTYSTVEDLINGNSFGINPFTFHGINDSLMNDLDLKENILANLESDKLSVSDNEPIKVNSSFKHENNFNFKKPELSADDKKVFLEIKKNLFSRDYNLIDDGVKKLILQNKQILFEILLEGCSISQTNAKPNRWDMNPNYFQLNTNKNFTGTGPAQPYLNYALFQILANLPKGTNVVDSLFINQKTYLDTTFFNFKGLYSHFITLNNFSILDSLKIDFAIFHNVINKNEGHNPNISRENWFKDLNLKKLEISNFSGSFKFLKNLKNLEYLSIEFGYYTYDFIQYFEFLENIKTLNLTNFNIESNYITINDLDFLKNSKKLKSLNISLSRMSINYFLRRSFNMDVIKNFNSLESLVLRGMSLQSNLDFLLGCRGLKHLVLDFESDLQKNIDLKFLRNCSQLENLYLNNVGELNITGTINNINQLNGLENLKTLNIDDITINGFNGKVFFE